MVEKRVETYANFFLKMQTGIVEIAKNPDEIRAEKLFVSTN